MAVCGLLLPATRVQAQAGIEAERWSLSAALSSIYAGNVLFSEDAGPGEFVGTAALGLGWARVDSRTQLTVSGFGSYRDYRSSDVFDGGRVAVGGAASHAFTPRFRGSASYGYSRGISALGLSLDQVLLPDVDIRSHAGTAGLTFLLTPRTTATLSGSVTRFDYRADRSFEGTLLPLLGESLATGTFGLEPGPDGDPVIDDPFASTRSFLASAIAGGVASEAVVIDSYRGDLTLTHVFSERTHASLFGGVAGIRSDGSALQPRGRHVDAGAAFAHRLAPTWDLSLSYSYSTDDAQEPPVDLHSGQLGLGKRLSRRVRADAGIGIAFLDDPGGSSRNVVGSFGISGRGDRSVFSLGYRRSAVQALALGRTFISDFVDGSWSRLLTKRLSASLYGAYQHSRDPLVGGFDFETEVVSVSLARRVKRRTAISASYSFRRLDREDQPAILGSVFGLSISYGRIWK